MLNSRDYYMSFFSCCPTTFLQCTMLLFGPLLHLHSYEQILYNFLDFVNKCVPEKYDTHSNISRIRFKNNSKCM